MPDNNQPPFDNPPPHDNQPFPTNEIPAAGSDAQPAIDPPLPLALDLTFEKKRKKPVKLDEVKRREVLAILGVGGTRVAAAEYVGCHPNTIRRTAIRDPDFARALRKATTTNEVNFLRSISNAAGDMRYWRAAAWALEHLYPERYAARRPTAFGGDQLRLVLNYFVTMIRKEIPDDQQRQRVRQRIERIIFRLERAGGGAD